MHMGHNATWAIWLVYSIGAALHVLLQADATARAKNNPLMTWVAVIKQNAIRMAARTFVGTLLFAYVWSNPTSIKDVLGHVGVTFGPQMDWLVALPMSWPLAGLYGFFTDTILAFIPGLKNALPEVTE